MKNSINNLFEKFSMESDQLIKLNGGQRGAATGDTYAILADGRKVISDTDSSEIPMSKVNP